ncbi:hypothetical protein BGZ63DRAFT_424625 [Mariannaea sp. PMI_226]|nr:hypothetical protein BGZ63DRAFT_424625 [Mariannaea sp. PMI_226]
MADRPNDPSMPTSSMDTSSMTTANKNRPLDAKGTIGQQFTETGAIGGTAQKIGGPFDKEGMIGKQFTTEGSLGGMVQNMAGGKKE